jgi:hypothetical protein
MGGKSVELRFAHGRSIAGSLVRQDAQEPATGMVQAFFKLIGPPRASTYCSLSSPGPGAFFFIRAFATASICIQRKGVRTKFSVLAMSQRQPSLEFALVPHDIGKQVNGGFAIAPAMPNIASPASADN